MDNGMMTKVWGPPGWLFLHCVTFGYPFKIDEMNPEHLEKKNFYKNFFFNLGKVLPCKYCRESYDKYFKEIPIDNFLNTRKELCLWLYLIHNKVNDKLGVPTCDIPSFDEVHTKYESYRAQCKKTTTKERLKNIEKGCIKPADGISKKSVLTVVTNQNNTYNILLSIIILSLIYFLFIFIIKNINKFKKFK